MPTTKTLREFQAGETGEASTNGTGHLSDDDGQVQEVAPNPEPEAAPAEAPAASLPELPAASFPDDDDDDEERDEAHAYDSGLEILTGELRATVKNIKLGPKNAVIIELLVTDNPRDVAANLLRFSGPLDVFITGHASQLSLWGSAAD